MTSDQVHNLTCMYGLGRGILIPYPELSATDCTPTPWSGANPPDYWRIRLLHPKVIGSDRIRYLGPRGRPPRLYVPPIEPFVGGYLAEPRELFITEGERKALKGTQEGIPTLGIPGVYAWKRSGSSDLRTTLDDIRMIPWRGRDVVLVYDSDITRAHPAYQAFFRLGRVLMALGAHDVRVITLPGGRRAA